ncbi:hypothetical protein HKCCE4037_16705 [Rhodobacterales bacterium HKCCE4037]|nr:hypothetical protein [Rhodobacterales bacterium HKCCE4037]
MAREAEPDPGETELEDGAPFTLTRALRFLEGLVFCCLAAVVVLWAVDRSRDVGFDPVTVELCDGEACADPADSAYSQYADTLDPAGLTVFSAANTCVFATDLLRSRVQDEDMARTLDLMQSRGTIAVTLPGDGTAIIAPGPNNDGLGDVARDAIRPMGPRGCHPMNYAPIFWPLWTVWMLLIGWRLFRYRQSVWAER